MAYTFLGTYTGTCRNVLGNAISNSAFKVDVYYEQNITNNTTSVKIKPYVVKSGHGESVTWYFKVDGNDYYNVFCNTYVNSRVDGSETYKTINHNADGTKTFTLNVSVETSYTQGANANLNNSCMKSGSLSVDLTLPTIPRASDFSLPSFTMGSEGTITISRFNSAFTHKVYAYFGSRSATISTSAGTSCSWTPSRDWGDQIPSSLSGTGTIVVDTYNGSTKIGSKSKSFTLWVTGDMQPSAGTLNISGVNLWNSMYVLNHSGANASISGASGSYGSTIKSYRITGQQLNVNSSSGSIAKFTSSGTFTYTATVTDTRGRTATTTKQIVVQNYTPPRISEVNFFRCNSSGTPNNEGTYVKATIRFDFANIGSKGVNAKQYSVNKKKTTESSYTNIVALSNASSYSFVYSTPVFSGYAQNDSFDFQITAKDSFNTATAYGSISAATCIMNIEQEGVGIGKYHQKGSLDVGGDIYCSSWLSADGGIDTKTVNTKTVNTTTVHTNGLATNTFAINQSHYGIPIEIGQYIDLHNIGSTSDVDVRIDTGGARDRIRVSNGGDLTKYVDLGYKENFGFIKVGKPDQWLNLYDDGSIKYGGKYIAQTKATSFTPYLHLSNGTTFTNSSAVGQYTYIGDYIYFQCRVIANAPSNVTSLNEYVRVGGLPKVNTYNYPAVTVGWLSGTDSQTSWHGYGAYVDGSSSYIQLTVMFTSGIWQGLRGVHLKNGGSVDVSLSGMYRWR